MTRKAWTPASVWRALEVHYKAGAITYLSVVAPNTPTEEVGTGTAIRHYPENPEMDLNRTTKFDVQVYGLSDIRRLTVDEASAMAYGLAAAERRYAG